MISIFFQLFVRIFSLIFSDPLDRLATEHETNSGANDQSNGNVDRVMHIVRDSRHSYPNG